MRYVVGVLAFIFLTPLCMIAGFFSTCLFAGLAGGNEAAMTAVLFSGPVLGLLGSIALTVLIVRSMGPRTV
jgi:hypothetical protein